LSLSQVRVDTGVKKTTEHTETTERRKRKRKRLRREKKEPFLAAREAPFFSLSSLGGLGVLGGFFTDLYTTIH